MAKKFQELTKWLQECGKDQLTLSFADIENILGFKLKSSAYNHSAYWHSSPTHMLPKAWEEAGYILYNLDFKERRATLAKVDAITKQITSEYTEAVPNSTPTVVRGRPQRPTSSEHKSLISERIKELCKNFMEYVRKSENKYTGPSVYFHLRTVATFKELGSNVSKATKNPHFCELLYATLVSWGMHAMKGPKMPDFESFSSGIATQSQNIEALSSYQITNLLERDVPSIMNDVWRLILTLPGSKTESKLVANSKLLHHLLPRLIPPIDRANIGLFFGYEKDTDFQGNIEDKFKLIYQNLVIIAQNTKSTLDSFPYADFNSSPTKLIDNAIIGYVIDKGLKENLKDKKRRRKEE